MKTLLLALALAAGCAHAPLAPTGALEADGLARLYCVDHPACTVYRSAQPTGAQLATLARRYGIRSVLKLNKALPFDGGPDTLPPGVDLIHDPMLPAGPVGHAELSQAVEDLEQAPKPALVHCTHGVDRTGLVIALWRVRHGALPLAAWGEWIAYGRDMNLVLFTEAFERETGWQAP